LTHLARVVTSSIVLLMLGFAGLLAVVGLSYVLAERSRTGLEASIVSREISVAADRLRAAVQAAESSQRGYLLTRNQIYLAPFGTARAEAEESLGRLAQLLASDVEGAPAFARLSLLIDEKFDEMDRTINLQRDRQYEEALREIQSDRGKALMDEANVFMSSIVRRADRALTGEMQRQADSLSLLRQVTIGVAGLVVIVVASVISMLWSFGRRLTQAKAQVDTLNNDLERRVELRTRELASARDRAELLMREVNHRVSNSLSIVASLLSMQARHQPDEQARKILNDTQARIAAVALVHRKLYTSGDVRVVDVGEFLATLLAQLERSLRDAGSTATVRHELASVNLSTDKSVTLGIVVSELVTNAFKYAYPQREGEIRVNFRRLDGDEGELLVEDDGIGIGDGHAPRGTGLGSKLVQAMAGSLGGSIEYRDRTPGTSVRLVMPLA
jgi:two-component sensor histidine kinase